MKLKRFRVMTFLAVVLILIIAIMDYQPYPQSFWGYSIVLGLILAIVYYLFRKDISESIAIFLIFYINLIFGLEDLIFYIIGGSIPQSMPHLYNHMVIGFIAKQLGLMTVTPLSLVISVAIGGIIIYFLIKYLKEKW